MELINRVYNNTKLTSDIITSDDDGVAVTPDNQSNNDCSITAIYRDDVTIIKITIDGVTKTVNSDSDEIHCACAKLFEKNYFVFSEKVNMISLYCFDDNTISTLFIGCTPVEDFTISEYGQQTIAVSATGVIKIDSSYIHQEVTANWNKDSMRVLTCTIKDSRAEKYETIDADDSDF